MDINRLSNKKEHNDMKKIYNTPMIMNIIAKTKED